MDWLNARRQFRRDARVAHVCDRAERDEIPDEDGHGDRRPKQEQEIVTPRDREGGGECERKRSRDQFWREGIRILDRASCGSHVAQSTSGRVGSLSCAYRSEGDGARDAQRHAEETTPSRRKRSSCRETAGTRAALVFAVLGGFSEFARGRNDEQHDEGCQRSDGDVQSGRVDRRNVSSSDIDVRWEQDDEHNGGNGEYRQIGHDQRPQTHRADLTLGGLGVSIGETAHEQTGARSPNAARAPSAAV